MPASESAAGPLQLVVLISGSGSNLQAIIDAIESGRINARINAVISDKPAAYGLLRARQHRIPSAVVEADDGESRADYGQRLAQQIDRYQPQLIVMAGFMRFLDESFVNRYAGRMLNIHPSLLPRYRGLHTHRRVLEAGDAEHGASVHFVTAELDGGPVIMQTRLAVQAGDDEKSLAARILEREHRLYPAVIGLYAADRLAMHQQQAWLDGKPLQAPLELESATWA